MAGRNWTEVIRSQRPAQRLGNDRGVALVEFALIFPILALLLFGMISAGLALNTKQEMTSATREGARYAAAVPSTQTFTTGTWASNVRDLVVRRSNGALQPSDVCVSLVEGGTATVVTPTANFSTSGTPCIPGETFPVVTGDPGRRVQVTASKPGAIQLVVFGSYNFTIDTRATVRSESRA